MISGIGSGKKIFKTFILGIPLIYSFTIAVHSDPLDYYFQRLQEKTHKIKALRSDSVTENYYDQLVDHAAPARGTFPQRYYLDESYAAANNAPVFLYLCGEGLCESTVFDGTIRKLAQKYHARLVALEHRYYGKSIPTKTFSREDLKYLNNENVLTDIVRFEKDMIHDKHWADRWIVFGGSYSGALAAYYREKFPDLVVGAVASSAPVMPKETFEAFDAHVTKIAGPECADNIRSAVHEIELAMSDDEYMTEIKAKFRATAVQDNTDFLQLIADVASGAVQYGYKDVFCGILSQSPVPLDGFALFTNYMLDALGLDAVQLTPQGAMSENPADYEGMFGMRQWSYQVCTEFGSWATANPDPEKSTRSQLLNAEYNQNICRRLFGLEEKPNTEYLYNHFYTPLLDESVSKIYFTNGSDDPWSRMSMIDENGNTTNKNLSYFLIEGGAHCDDLRKDDDQSASLREAREKMDALIGSWLAN